MASRIFSHFYRPPKLNLLDSCSKSPIQYVFENVLGKTREALRFLIRKPSKLQLEFSPTQQKVPVNLCIKEILVSPKSRLFRYRPGSITNLTSKWVSDSLAARANREFRRRAFQRGGPMLGLVGFVLAKKPSLLTEDEERESVAFTIRDTFSKIPWQDIGLNIEEKYSLDTEFSLSNIKFGDMLAKGCNAAVYSAHYQSSDVPSTAIDNAFLLTKLDTSVTAKINDAAKNKEIASGTSEDEILPSSKLFMPHSEGGINTKHLDVEEPEKKHFQLPTGEFHPFNLAVKVMFNYSAESNSYAIFNAMHKEILPALADFSLEEDDCLHKVRKKRLKPHPNIVEMYFAFADMVPFLPGARQYFPQALPVRLLNDGCGRNMTLFLVMKRYHCSLKEYLEKYTLSPHTSLLLFTQLMEALAHLYECGIAHRDLKTDNILLDLSQGITSPLLAITDFGCCSESLHLNYSSPEISKGGNMALMAPEVVKAEAGPLSTIDYSRSDLWTAGTMAYEIFGGTNPFYSKMSNLKSHSYKESSLPPLPAAAPVAIQKLVREMLYKDPSKRPSQTLAATVCQILLHAPPQVLGFDKESKTILEWMFLMSAKTYLQTSLKRSAEHNVEFVLRHTFCSRIQYLEVLKALKYILE